MSDEVSRKLHRAVLKADVAGYDRQIAGLSSQIRTLQAQIATLEAYRQKAAIELADMGDDDDDE